MQLQGFSELEPARDPCPIILENKSTIPTACHGKGMGLRPRNHLGSAQRKEAQPSDGNRRLLSFPTFLKHLKYFSLWTPRCSRRKKNSPWASHGKWNARNTISKYSPGLTVSPFYCSGCNHSLGGWSFPHVQEQDWLHCLEMQEDDFLPCHSELHFVDKN